MTSELVPLPPDDLPIRDVPERHRAAKPIKRTKKSIRMEKAVALRARGATWDEIAQALGYKDKRVAAGVVYRYLRKVAQHSEANVEAYRQELLEKLDEVEAACWEVLRRKHITVQNGKVVSLRDDSTGEYNPIEDDGPVLQAVDRLLKIYERKAKLSGVDMTPENMIGVAVQYTVQGTEISDYQ